MNAGVELVVSTLVVGSLGLGLDRWLGSTPLFLFLGLLSGMAGALWIIARDNSRNPPKK